MKRIIRFLLPILILLISIGFAATLIANSPETTRQRPKIPLPTVEVLALQPQDYQIKIPSQGTISPKTESDLVAEVSGKIVRVAKNFHNGGFFEAGDELLQIDPRDYQNAVTIAQAELSLNRLALAEEQARSEQARSDWEKLQLKESPSPLLLRIPQLENSKAALAAAEARLQQAKVNLERTRITAPYAGRILKKVADLGQYISAGTPLAQIYASDALEVRLPINNEQIRYLQLPEDFRYDSQQQAGTKVLFYVNVSDQTFTWQGQLIRTEGSVDIDSRQLFIIARINNPYLRQGNRPQLKIGQFIQAHIWGNRLENVFIIPRQAVHGEKTIYLITDENLLQRRDLEILWRDKQHLITKGPLQPGDRISMTDIPFAADGIKVRIADGSEVDKSQRKKQLEPKK